MLLRRFTCLALITFIPLTLNATADPRHEIHFPDIPGYNTLICDFHTHTVFSDGNVWPTVRMQEAWREGIDAIAVTDHIEYQPHKDYIPTNLNASYEIAKPEAERNKVMLIKGTEITRGTPPGHFNAIFIKDVDPISTEDFMDAVEAAANQGGFVFWNHPLWKGPERGRWREVHQALYDKKWLGGVEVLNGRYYSPEAHQWCLDKNLAMLGNSDIHQPSMRHDSIPGNHRALTLVFAKKFTQKSIKKALEEARTAAWDENRIIGREEHLAPLFKASVEVFAPHLTDEENNWIEIKNHSHLTYQLKRTGNFGPATIEVEANASIIIRLSLNPENDDRTLHYTAENVLIAPNTGLPVELVIPKK